MTQKTSARRAAPLTFLRAVHGYLGMLIAPATIFMAATGILQVYSLHEAHPGYTPPPLIEKLAMLHKKQLFAQGRHQPDRGASPAPGSGGHHKGKPGGHADAAAAAAAPANGPNALSARPALKLATTLLKAFFALAAAGLIVSTLTGVWMALRQPLRRGVYLALLAIGAIVPIILAAASN